jgi:hypothetical protein
MRPVPGALSLAIVARARITDPRPKHGTLVSRPGFRFTPEFDRDAASDDGDPATIDERTEAT